MVKISGKYFKVDGKKTILFGSGMSGLPGSGLYGDMIRCGVNSFHRNVLFVTTVEGPWKCTPGKTIHENWGGWNDQWFTNLRREVKRVNDSGAVHNIIVGSIPTRRKFQNRTSLWDHHLWNADNGGLIDARKNGVVEFYSEPVGEGKFRELLDKIALCLKGTNYIVTLMWELFNAAEKGGLDWALRMARYWQNRNGKIPIGIGSYKGNHGLFINERTENWVFSLYEGWRPETMNVRTDRYNFPVVYAGYWPQIDMYYENRSNEEKREIMTKGNEIENTIATVRQIEFALMNGMNIGLPFQQYFSMSPCWKEIGMERKNLIDFNKLQELILGYTSGLKFSGININRKLKKLPVYTNNYIRRIT